MCHNQTHNVLRMVDLSIKPQLENNKILSSFNMKEFNKDVSHTKIKVLVNRYIKIFIKKSHVIIKLMMC